MKYGVKKCPHCRKYCGVADGRCASCGMRRDCADTPTGEVVVDNNVFTGPNAPVLHHGNYAGEKGAR